MSKPESAGDFSDFDIHHPNDHFFRGWMGKPHVASGFFREYLPAGLSEWLDSPERLHLEHATFVDEALRGTEADLLWRCEKKDGGDAAYIYILFEHQSEPDPEMPMRLLRYMLRIWARNPGESNSPGYPFIFPVLLYQGKTDWSQPTCFSELIDLPDHQMSPFSPDFEFLLVSLKDLDLEHLTPAELRLGLQAMALTIRGRAIDWIPQSLEGVDEAGFRFMLRYIFAIMGREETNVMIQEVKTLEGRGPELAISAYESLLREGEEKGIEKGARKIALRLFESGATASEISRLVDLPLADVEQLIREEK